MRKLAGKKKSVIIYGGSSLLLYGWAIVTHGFVTTFNSVLQIMTWYYMVWGVILFFFAWLPRYRAVKRVEKSGLMYLVLLREQFGRMHNDQ